MTNEAAAIFQEIFDRVHNRGQSVQQAFDSVMGEGAFEKLASDIWEAAQ